MNATTLISAIAMLAFYNTNILAETQHKCPQHKQLEIAPESLSDLESATDLANAHLTMEAPTESPEAPEESRRFQLFRMEKDYHAKNVLHYGINVNTPSCTITQTQNGAPSFNNYWHMGEEKGQKKLMTKKDLERLGPVVVSHTPNRMVFKMNAFKDLKLKKKEITVSTTIVNNECQVSAQVELDDGRQLNLTRIYAKMSYFLGLPTGVSSLSIEGRNLRDGSPVKMTME